MCAQLVCSILPVECSDQRGGGGNGGDFVAGFLLGGAIFGTLGYIFAPQVILVSSLGINLISDSTTLICLLGTVNIVAYFFLLSGSKNFAEYVCAHTRMIPVFFFHNEAAFCNGYQYSQDQLISYSVKRLSLIQIVLELKLLFC